MDWKNYLEIMHTLEKLKNQTRHSYTSMGRHESVAEHSWRLCMMAYFLADRFPDLNQNRLIEMCLFHDIGEIFTGDIPAFQKTDADREKEDRLLVQWIEKLPDFYRERLTDLFAEMNRAQMPDASKEAALYKALDKMEAVLAHNESDLRTWIPLEYDLQLTYGADEVAAVPGLQGLKDAVNEETRSKIETGRKSGYVTECIQDLTEIASPENPGIIRLVLGDCFTNCYLVFDRKTKEAMMIDPADDASTILQEVRKNNLHVKYIFVTHGHADHILALKTLKEVLNPVILISRMDAPRLTDETSINERPYVVNKYKAVPADLLLTDGDEIRLGNLLFQTKLLPGHTEGSMALFTGNSAFTGDLLFADGRHGKTLLPGGNETEMKRSLAYLKQNCKGYHIYPGHKSDFQN